MYYDYYILGIILLPGILLSIYAQFKVTSTFNKYKDTPSSYGEKAVDLAKHLLNISGLGDIRVTQVRGELTDYYNYKKKKIALSESVYNSNSISAIGVACHEIGHALQYRDKYFPLKLRNFIIPICNFSNRFIWILILIGGIFYYTNWGSIFIYIGIGIFALSVLLNLITLPVEYNASRRACELLRNNLVMTEDELEKTKSVLNAAALTYVAGLIVSILNLLRLILTFKDRTD